jgi:hydrogenase-4 component F
MAFVAILRVKQVVDAAGAGDTTQLTLLAFGLFSMLVAALFLLGTPDFKRMLAYSSVEHMGILAVGAALGEAGLWAALFHLWTNGLTKGALFLSAGNIRRAAGARTQDKVAGMAWRSPMSARMLVVGILAVTACPPFGPFFSELKILLAAFSTQSTFASTAFLLCLLFAFFGLTRLVFAIVDGRPRSCARTTGEDHRETAGVILPPLAFLACSAWLGLATPSLLGKAWTAATHLLGPTP